MANHPYGMTRIRDNIPFDEGQHPRGPDGRFIFAGGGGGYDFGGMNSRERPTAGNRPWAGGAELRDPPASADRPEMRPYTAASFTPNAGESGGAAQIPIAAEVPPQRELAWGAVPPMVRRGAVYMLQQTGRVGVDMHRHSETLNEPELKEDIEKLEEKQRTQKLSPDEERRLEHQRKLLEELEESQRLKPGDFVD